MYNGIILYRGSARSNVIQSKTAWGVDGKLVIIHFKVINQCPPEHTYVLSYQAEYTLESNY